MFTWCLGDFISINGKCLHNLHLIFFVLFYFGRVMVLWGAFFWASGHCKLYVHCANHLRGISWKGALVKWLMWSRTFMEIRRQNEHIPLFYKKCHSIFIAAGVWQCVLKPLNVNQCQPIDSFTLSGSQNCNKCSQYKCLLCFFSVFSCI